MTTQDHFRDVMAKRRAFRHDPRWRIEWDYMTRAARKLLWTLRGVPVSEWSK